MLKLGGKKGESETGKEIEETLTTDTENQAEQKMRQSEKHQAIISDTSHRHVALAHPSSP